MKPVVTEGGESSGSRGGWRRGVAIFDLLLRLMAIGAILAAAIAMGTTDQTLPFFTQFFQFEAKYSDMPAFTFFVIANAVACGYLVLSLTISIFNIVRPHAAATRMLLIFFDTAMLALATAGASSAAAIVYLAHKGNARANWFSICQQFDSFCERISGALIGSFSGVAILLLLVFLSATALYKH